MKIITGIVSKVEEYLVEPSINQARYLFHFNKIVEDLTEVERILKSKQRDVNEQLEAAERNDEKIKTIVQDWLSDSRNIMGEVETLKGKIEVNKTFLNGWCPNWFSRHRLGRKATKTSIRLKAIIDRGQFEGVVNRALQLGEPSAPKDFDFCRSMRDAFDKIMEALKNDGTHMVILYGMGGVGKTTLAKAVSKRVTEESIFKEVVMVTVSQTPNFMNIQDQLASLLNLDLMEKTEEGRAKRLSSILSKSNSNLIILDDVWEEFNFEEKIGVPLSKGCKMLLTTRNRNLCTDSEYRSLIPLKVLDEHEGVALLKRQAGIDDGCVGLNTLATRIAKECDGLPLALVTIGSHLRGKDTKTWELVCEKLKKSKLEDLYFVNSTERGLYASLKLSYDYLKTDEIKFCFLICSLFPEDFEIPLEDLVRIGVGLDLYYDVSSIEGARRVLRSMVETLKALGLLLDAHGKEFVRMHEIVRDFSLWIASRGENIFMSKIGIDLSQLQWEKGWKQYAAISLLESKLKELSVRLVCPKLKILLLGGENQWLSYRYDKSNMLKVSDECFEDMKALEVVSLRYVDLSLKSLQFLTNLKTLELSNCNLRDISFLAKLNKLEILSFRGSRFDELPIELSELKKLRMLDLRQCYELKRIPTNLIGSFSQLEELYMEVKDCKDLKCMIDLSQVGEENFELHPSLAKLDLEGLPELQCIWKGPTPSHGVNYQSLTHVYVRKCKRLAYIFTLPTARSLGQLKSLHVIDCESLEFLIKIEEGDNGRGENVLSKLEDLQIQKCKRLEYVFPVSVAPGLIQLKNLQIEDAPELKQVFY